MTGLEFLGLSLEPTVSTSALATSGWPLIISPTPKIVVNSVSTSLRCAVKGASPPRVQVPPGSWFAPPGSNQSGDGGNEVVGASGVEGHLGDLASM